MNKPNPEKILTALVEVWCDQYGVTPSNITITKVKGEQSSEIYRKSTKSANA